MAGDLALLRLTGDEGRVTKAILWIVEDSFVTHPMRHITQAEVKRRTDFVLEKFRFFRSERRWPVDKALSHLRPALKAALDTNDFAVRERTLYVPDQGLIQKGIIAR